MVGELNELAHQLDPGRMTSIRKYYEGSHLVDVFSPSIWSGWYAGVYKNYKNALEDQRKNYDRFLHMEYGGSSHVGYDFQLPQLYVHWHPSPHQSQSTSQKKHIQ